MAQSAKQEQSPARPLAPVAAVALLALWAALGGEMKLLPFRELDVTRFAAVLLIFATIAAVVERSVEILMMIRFPTPRTPEEAELQAMQASHRVNMALEEERLAHATNPSERLEVLKGFDNGEIARLALDAEKARLNAQPGRTYWSLAFGVAISGCIAASGALLLTHLIKASVADNGFNPSPAFLVLDVIVTALTLAGGANWFHSLVKTLTPADPKQS